MGLRGATVAAIAAHVAAVGAIALVPLRAHVELRAPEPATVDVEEEGDEGANASVAASVSTPPSPEPPGTTAAPGRVARASDAPRATPGSDAVASVTPAPNGEPSPLTTEPSGDGAWSFNVATRRFDATARGLVGAATPAAPPNEAPSKPAPGSPSGGVTEALDEHDVKLGIARGGEVLSAMEAVARSGNVPIRGNATFVVVVDARGRVAVSLQDASEGFDAWSRELGAMRDAVSSRHVRLPPGANGLQIMVRLESRVVYVDGRDPRADGARVKATGLKLSETKSQIVIEELPSISAGVRGKVCGAGVSVGLGGITIAGGCSPENIGAPETRIVSGKVVSESRL